MALFLGRLAPDTRPRDLEDLFAKYGKVIRLDIKRGFGFVEYEDPRDGEEAVSKLNGHLVNGGPMVVEFAKNNGRRAGENECYKCGKEGHWARDCKGGGSGRDRDRRRSRSPRRRSRSPRRDYGRDSRDYGRDRGGDFGRRDDRRDDRGRDARDDRRDGDRRDNNRRDDRARDYSPPRGTGGGASGSGGARRSPSPGAGNRRPSNGEPRQRSASPIHRARSNSPGGR
ncbi:hypothetical protein CPB97_008296 [Podila verticillata]|nr:hypothetical protein CPB97_008296 [Podila verticillata]